MTWPNGRGSIAGAGWVVIVFLVIIIPILQGVQVDQWQADVHERHLQVEWSPLQKSWSHVRFGTALPAHRGEQVRHVADSGVWEMECETPWWVNQ